jgi:hypothetical protein
MDIIDGVFGEAEFRAMPDAMMVSLGKLLDDKLSMRIKEYMNKPDSDKQLCERIQNLIGNKLELCTFHTIVLEKGLVDLVAKLALPTLVDSDVDLDNLEEQLTWLQEHKSSLKSIIEPRNTNDFNEFMEHVKELEKNIMPSQREYGNLPARVKANKQSFCAANEKARATRIGLLVSHSQTWEIALSGAKFLKYCKSRGIDGWLRREF